MQTLKTSTSSELVDACKNTCGSFEIRVHKQSGFIVMRTSDLDGESSLNEAEKNSLRDGQ